MARRTPAQQRERLRKLQEAQEEYNQTTAHMPTNRPNPEEVRARAETERVQKAREASQEAAERARQEVADRLRRERG